MPDSSDSILTRLRSWGPVECPWTFENVPVVRLADAEAAVRDTRDATVKEIEAWLTSADTTDLAVDAFVRDGRSGAATVAQMAAALDALLADIARRFPNGGTHE